MTQEFALIVAGGKGTRFGSATPKQFLELGGKPVVMRTIEAFFQYSDSIQVILVLPAQELSQWSSLVNKHRFPHNVIVEAGGATRFQSVQRGLSRARGEGYVAIHDGVRPLVHPQIIARSFEGARRHGASAAAVHLKESLRKVSDDNDAETVAVDRSEYRLMQTPQTFELSLIRRAYQIPEDESLTDDASVAERAGLRIVLFQGDYRNIKITSPEDLAIAEALLKVPRM